MKRPAKKVSVNQSVLGAIGAAVIGVFAGAAAMFLSEKENRKKVEKTVGEVVKKGRVEVAKATKKVVATKKRIIKK